MVQQYLHFSFHSGIIKGLTVFTKPRISIVETNRRAWLLLWNILVHSLNKLHILWNCALKTWNGISTAFKINFPCKFIPWKIFSNVIGGKIPISKILEKVFLLNLCFTKLGWEPEAEMKGWHKNEHPKWHLPSLWSTPSASSLHSIWTQTFYNDSSILSLFRITRTTLQSAFPSSGSISKPNTVEVSIPLCLWNSWWKLVWFLLQLKSMTSDATKTTQAFKWKVS